MTFYTENKSPEETHTQFKSGCLWKVGLEGKVGDYCL